MANNKQRYINTRLWNDSYVSRLDPIEKLLFIYSLTNEHTNISGMYEVPLKIIAIETGIDVSMLEKMFVRLQDKINYVDGFIIIKNFVKHQETDSLNVKKGILNCLKEIDLNFVKRVIEQGYYVLPSFYLDTLCIPYTQGQNYLDSNSNLDSINTPIKKEKKEEIQLPNWLNVKAWEAWLQYKKERKQKMTPSIIKFQLNVLEKNQQDHTQIIKNSITNGWTGLFALKKDGFVQKTPPRFVQPNTSKEDNDRRNELLKQSEGLVKKFQV